MRASFIAGFTATYRREDRFGSPHFHSLQSRGVHPLLVTVTQGPICVIECRKEREMVDLSDEMPSSEEKRIHD
jgi:hypothetical protein